MNKRLLLLCLLCGNAFAEPESLAPVVDNSSYYNGGQGTVPGALDGGRVNNAKSGNSATAMYEVLGQLEQLQKELRQLSGTVEEQAHDLAEIKKRQTTMYDDIDQRLQALETSKGAVANAAPVIAEPAPSAAPAPVAETPAPAPVVPPVETAAPVSAAQPISALATPAPPTSVNNGASKYPQEIYSEAKDSKPVAPVVKNSEKEQYQSAYDTLRDGHYSRAIEALNAQLAAYPNGEYAANAQYWLGEAYKVTQNINASRDAFNKVVTNYPASPKVSDALLKLGYLEIEQDNLPKAREYLNRVSTSYPNTTAAHLAAKKLGALNGAPR